METLAVHHMVDLSRANGPGCRAVIWTQGCTLACPGCFNAPTHGASEGTLVAVDELFERLAAIEGIEGVSLSGGEPLQQRKALMALLRRIRRETTLSVLLFSGFTWEEVAQMPEADELIALVDVLIAGRYDQSRRVARDLRGSENKVIHLLSARYTLGDLSGVPPAEVHILPDGAILFSGIDPLSFS